MVANAVLPIMIRLSGGAIVNVSSIAAIRYTGIPYVAYGASKAAIIQLTQSIAIEHARQGIRCNAILPGLMDTPMAVDRRVEATGRTREDIAAERNARVPLLNRMGTGWDVAHAALFLASDDAGFITGVELPVDGGSLARVG